MRILKPTKQVIYSHHLIGFDIETFGQKNKFYMGSVYGMLRKKDKYSGNNIEAGEFYKVFYDKDEMISFILSKKFRGYTFIATNLSFDLFGLIFGEEHEKKFKYCWRGSNLLQGKTYVYKGKPTINQKHKGCKICFIDSGNYGFLSVERMGKIIGLPKLDKPEFLGKKPKNKYERVILETYNIRDSEITYKFTKFLYEAFEDLGATPKITIASTSMSIFKNCYLKDVYFQQPLNLILEQFECYFGGRVECFKRGEVRNYKLYDVNSLYPAMMCKTFPNPNKWRISYKNEITHVKLYEGSSHVKVFVPEMKYPPLPFRTEKGKVIFPFGTWEGWFTHVDLRYALSLGCVIQKVYKTIYYTETCTPFKEFVNDLYIKRMEYKKQGSPMEYVVKILMNSLYGKFGQRFLNRDNYISIEEVSPEDLKVNKYTTFERIGNFVRVKEDGLPACFCVPIWAAYVTSYARIHLHKLLVKHNAIYCDTDSIVTKDEIKETSGLGGLKKEMEIATGVIIRPKFYGFTDHENDRVKIKGVSKRLNYLEFRGFLHNPVIAQKKFVKFREALRRGLTPNEIIDVIKNLSLEDDKRRWENMFKQDSNEISRPLEIKEGNVLPYVKAVLLGEYQEIS